MWQLSAELTRRKDAKQRIWRWSQRLAELNKGFPRTRRRKFMVEYIKSTNIQTPRSLKARGAIRAIGSRVWFAVAVISDSKSQEGCGGFIQSCRDRAESNSLLYAPE